MQLLKRKEETCVYCGSSNVKKISEQNGIKIFVCKECEEPFTL